MLPEHQCDGIVTPGTYGFSASIPSASTASSPNSVATCSLLDGQPSGMLAPISACSCASILIRGANVKFDGHPLQKRPSIGIILPLSRLCAAKTAARQDRVRQARRKIAGVMIACRADCLSIENPARSRQAGSLSPRSSWRSESAHQRCR